MPKHGYVSKSLTSDIVLGGFDGLDNALWGYGFASILFAGALTPFLPLGVAIILAGWGMIGLFVAVTSRSAVHIASIDEQGVVILASIGVTLSAYLGPDAGGPAGLSTMLALMAITSFMVMVAFFMVGHWRLTRLLELLPFPVICGFMAGVGWLLLEAAVYVTVDAPIDANLPTHLSDNNETTKLLATLGCGVLMVLFTTKVKRAWAMPVAAALIFVGFYAVVNTQQISHETLLAGGWIFNISDQHESLSYLISMASLSAIDMPFVLSVWPELLAIVFLALLSASMSLTALSAAGSTELDNSQEIKQQGIGNVFCAAIACPPGYTDVAATMLYRSFGASSRWMPIMSALVCLLVAFAGGGLVALLPKVLVGATIFLFAYKLVVEWLFERVRGFQPVDYLIVCIILGMVIFVGFMVGILTGIILTLILFVLRYSMISAIHGQYTLREYRSSVERPPLINAVLDDHGLSSLVYTLRGFLFFGTANAILERIRSDLEATGKEHLSILLDFKRVTGMDISALNTFVQVKNQCQAMGVRLLYSDVPMDIQLQISALDAVSSEDGSPLFFDELDFAVENMEESILQQFAPQSNRMTIREQLDQILENPDRIQLIMHALQRFECAEGDPLFLQGDLDNGFYILESGALSAYIDAHDNLNHRVKKFGPGSLIGELSMFIPDRRRTATVIADVDSVLYFMSSEVVDSTDLKDSRLSSAVNELIARALGTRINYMNQRLMLELD